MEKLAIGDPVGNAFQSRARNDLNGVMTLGTIGLEQELAILGQGPGGWEECEEDEEQRVYLTGHVVAYGKIMPWQIKLPDNLIRQFRQMYKRITAGCWS